MKIVEKYNQLNDAIRSQYYEPGWGWGLRLAISFTTPLIWGVITGKHHEAEWMAIAGECIAFIELKGSASQRIRLLLAAAMLSILFCALGSFAGGYIVLSLIGMLVVGVLSGLMKNLGERGMGLALSIYIFYIITSSHPVHTWEELLYRCQYVAMGAVWAIAVGVFSFSFIKIGKPYRRSIANIWKSVGELALAVGTGWDGRDQKHSVRYIYLKEKNVRESMNTSLTFFEETSEEVTEKEKDKYALTQSRKCASLVSLHIINVADVVEQLSKNTRNKNINIQIFSIFRVLQQIGERMEVFLLTLREEERLIILSRVARLRKLIAQFGELKEEFSEISDHVFRVEVQLERIAKLIEKSLDLLSAPKERAVIQSYSFSYTLKILHPKYLKSNIKLLINPDSFTVRYAIRIGVSVFVGACIAYWLFPDHGYWIPFTAVVVSQPYVGATLKRGIERSLGTVAGIIVGTGFLLLPFPYVWRIVLVFLSSILLIYFLKRKYSISSFFITLMVVGLISIESPLNLDLFLTRIISTAIGSALAIVAGFVLLPSWDRNLLPQYLAEAINTNFKYFMHTFYYAENKTSWTKLKNKAESANHNAFDSLTRYLQEPGIQRRKRYYGNYYTITHNVRITRELNNYHLENEFQEDKLPIADKEKFLSLITACDDIFRDIMKKYKDSGNEFIDVELMKKFPVNGYIVTTPNQNQYLYVDKILIELKALQLGIVINAS